MSTTSKTLTAITREDEESAVWDAMASSQSIYMDMTEGDRRQAIQGIIKIHGGAQKAIEAYQAREKIINDPNTVRIGDQFPEEGLPYKSIEFDNIKIFYQLSRLPWKTWNVHIARPGAKPSECIDWRAAGIKVVGRGFDGRWGDCRLLAFPSEARIRIEYPFGKERRTHEMVFPDEGSPFPIHYLEAI